MSVSVKYPYIIIPLSAANGYGGMKSVGINHAELHMRPNELSALDEAESRLHSSRGKGMVVYKAVHLVAPESPRTIVSDIEIEEIDP